MASDAPLLPSLSEELSSESGSRFIRYRSRYPRSDGSYVGVFGLVNVLGRHGMLTPEEENYRREHNDWYDKSYPDPVLVSPAAYAHPLAAAWFKSSATSLLNRVPGYLAILTAHNVAWERLTTDDPGRICYEDDLQVIAIPSTARAP